MSSDPSRKSHALAWTLSLVIAVPLLYLLSVPPVYRCTNLYSNPAGVTHPRMLSPSWVIAYGEPYRWLAENTPLKKLLYRYADGWGLDWYGYRRYLNY